MKDYSEIFRSLYKVEIENNQNENKKKWRRDITKNILLGLLTFLVIIMFIMPFGLGLIQGHSLIKTYTLIREFISEDSIRIVVVIILIIIGIVMAANKSEKTNESLENAAYTFGCTYILQDILAIIYENFPPFIQSNMKKEIDDPKILHILTPLVTTDHNGHLNISSIGLDYTEKESQIAYQDGESKCYLEKIEYWPSRGKFKFHFKKVNSDATVEKIPPVEYEPK